MNINVKFRPCRPTDFEPVLNLLAQLWSDKPLDKEKLHTSYQSGLAGDYQWYIGAVLDDELIGFCSFSIRNSLWQQGPLAHIDELVVDKKTRGRGVGTQLIEHVADLAAEKGCSRLELDSALNSKDAHRFYQQCGFQNRAHLFSRLLK